MKKKLFTKVDDLFLLGIVSIFISSTIIVYAHPGLTCDNQGGGIASTGANWTEEHGQINYQLSDGTHQFTEPGSQFQGAQITIASESLNVSVTYNVFPTEHAVEVAKRDGNYCSDSTPCVTAAELGLSGDRSEWAEQIATAGKNEGKNGQSFDYSNPYSLEKAKIILKEAGFENVDSMSQKDVEEAATKIAQETGSFSASSFHYQSSITVTATNQEILCPGDPLCQQAYAEGWVVTAIYDMNQVDKKAITSDAGTMCKGPECPPTDDEKHKPKDFEGKVVPFTLNADTCDPVIPNIPEPDEKPVPKSEPDTLKCGKPYSSTSYEKYPVLEGLVYMLETTRTTINLPGPQGTLFIGKTGSNTYGGNGFNWGGVVTSYTNVSTTVWDVSKLEWKYEQINTSISATENAITCNQASLTQLEQDYAKESAACSEASSKASAECSKCKAECRGGATCDCDSTCSAAAQQSQECSNLAASYNSKKDTLNKKIEGLNSDVEGYKENLKDLDELTTQIPSGSSSTSSGTANLVNRKMVLNVNRDGDYVQNANDIKGIAKNSGNPLTQEEIDKMDSQNYLLSDYEFFIPYYIPNKTKGELIGDIVGDINIQEYKCPIDVANVIVCDSPGCNGELNIIYRPISLTNPFPNAKGIDNSKYRKMGSNWNSILATNFIEKNRNVDDYEIYSGNLTPIYTITLTPSTIKEIRKYNKQNSLNDFKMKCSDGYKCASSFLWDTFPQIIDESKSCASSTGWDTDCYYGR